MPKPSERKRGRRPPRRSAPGAAPGRIEPPPGSPRPVIDAIAYDAHELAERRIADLAEIDELLASGKIVWINVAGLGDAKIIERLGAKFRLHPLSLEDVVHTHQRAKVEPYAEFTYFVARMAREHTFLDTEQFSLFLGKNFVVTFLEDPGDSFNPVRERLRGGNSHLRTGGAGYLAYALIDAVVDAYFPLIERFGERLDRLEDRVVSRPGRQSIGDIHEAKHELRALRRAIWPLREAINSLVRDPSELLDDETRVHLRDCYDHVVQIIDLVETYRELCADMSDLYLSSLSNRMNEVMKVLTVIATIFMPLSFISGVYGMNFQTDRSPWNMPELRWRYGYPFALSLMAAVALGMVGYFYRKGWLAAESGLAREREAPSGKGDQPIESPSRHTPNP